MHHCIRHPWSMLHQVAPKKWVRERESKQSTDWTRKIQLLFPLQSYNLPRSWKGFFPFCRRKQNKHRNTKLQQPNINSQKTNIRTDSSQTHNCYSSHGNQNTWKAVHHHHHIIIWALFDQSGCELKSFYKLSIEKLSGSFSWGDYLPLQRITIQMKKNSLKGIPLRVSLICSCLQPGQSS